MPEAFMSFVTSVTPVTSVTSASTSQGTEGRGLRCWWTGARWKATRVPLSGSQGLIGSREKAVLSIC